MESENRPTSHPTHPSFLPTPVSARVCVPAGHCVHVLEAFAPIVSEYFPDAHSLHASAPASSTYVPLRHNEQVAAARTPELRPAGQKVQSTTVVDCNASRYLPAGQSVQ